MTYYNTFLRCLDFNLKHAGNVSCYLLSVLCLLLMHYANTPMQYIAIFHGCKNVNFQMNSFFFICFLFLLKNIDCGYTLEQPH